MDPKGQDILFNSEIRQKDLMIQMLSERLDEKDETITELKETINDLKETIAGLRETLDEFQRKLFGTGSEKIKQDKETEETVTTIVKSHKRTTRKAKATREDQYGNLPIHKEVIPLPEEDKYCPYCNSKMEYVTETFVREELRITPAKYVAMEKTGLAMPYYRQEFLMNQLGFTLPRETMANWIIYVAENYFYPIYERLHEELLKRDLVHADETTCQVLREKGRTAEQTSYMWLYTTGSDALTPIVLYDYQPSCKGSCAQNFLEGFRGLVQCDGYQGYNKLGKAVNYAQNHHDTLMNYLLDGRCEISNNRAERKAKSYAIGRKAFLFHTSETGAGASAVMYSIVETAKANNLNIFQYLYTVLLYMPDYTNSSAGIEQLMPWSEFIKEQCSGLIDVESNVPEKRIPLPHR